MNDTQNKDLRAKGAGIYKAGLYEEREVTGPLPRLSLEIFPPKSLAASFQLMDTLDRLAAFGPHFCFGDANRWPNARCPATRWPATRGGQAGAPDSGDGSGCPPAQRP